MERQLRGWGTWCFHKAQDQFPAPTWQLTNISNSGSRGSNSLFWPLKTTGMHNPYSVHTHIEQRPQTIKLSDMATQLRRNENLNVASPCLIYCFVLTFTVCMGTHACHNASVEARGQQQRVSSPSRVPGMELRWLGLGHAPLPRATTSASLVLFRCLQW